MFRYTRNVSVPTPTLPPTPENPNSAEIATNQIQKIEGNVKTLKNNITLEIQVRKKFQNCKIKFEHGLISDKELRFFRSF